MLAIPAKALLAVAAEPCKGCDECSNIFVPTNGLALSRPNIEYVM